MGLWQPIRSQHCGQAKVKLFLDNYPRCWVLSNPLLKKRAKQLWKSDYYRMKEFYYLACARNLHVKQRVIVARFVFYVHCLLLVELQIRRVIADK